ncbi:MAG: mechanosensitive ion channel family protein [Candidatus Sericytochromatia bacterium]|nr:mechanosensitive ion channel family protein [Candidatus Sericytochromatia bacterium]
MSDKLIDLAHLTHRLGLPSGLVALMLLLLLGGVTQALLRLGMKRAAILSERGPTPWNTVAIEALFPITTWGCWLAVGHLGLNLIEGVKIWHPVLRHLANVSAMLLVGWSFHRLIRGVEGEFLGLHRGTRDSGDRATIGAIGRLARFTVWILVGITILQAFGMSVSGLLAFGGIGGIAIGFAAKDILANLIGGISILLDRPFAAGDWIRSPDRELEGTVEHIGWRITRIRTFDQRPLYVPNALFSTVAIENPSRMLNRRIHELIGVRYDDAAKVDVLVSDIEAMLRQHEAIDQDRTLIVNLLSFGASSIDIMVYTFTRTTDWVTYHAIKQDILLRILAIITSRGAEIAFPTQTLHHRAPFPIETKEDSPASPIGQKSFHAGA